MITKHARRTIIAWRRETTLDIYILALAIALCAAPFVFSYALSAPRADDWAVGLLVLACAAAALLAFAEWEEWAMLALGLWVAASPWLLGFAHAKAMPINLGLGLAIAYLSALELWLIHYDPPPPDWSSDSGPATT
jgi:hypothetical protein